MHEVSIALDLVNLVVKKCMAEGYHSIVQVKVRLGRASGVSTEALKFALDVVKEETIAKEANFIIDTIPLGGTCNECGRQFETEEGYILACPFCGSSSFTIRQGYELEVVDMEVE